MTVIRHHENSECLKRKGEKGKINKTKTKNKTDFIIHFL